LGRAQKSPNLQESLKNEEIPKLAPSANLRYEEVKQIEVEEGREK